MTIRKIKTLALAFIALVSAGLQATAVAPAAADPAAVAEQKLTAALDNLTKEAEKAEPKSAAAPAITQQPAQQIMTPQPSNPEPPVVEKVAEPVAPAAPQEAPVAPPAAAAPIQMPTPAESPLG